MGGTQGGTHGEHVDAVGEGLVALPAHVLLRSRMREGGSGDAAVDSPAPLTPLTWYAADAARRQLTSRSNSAVTIMPRARSATKGRMTAGAYARAKAQHT